MMCNLLFFASSLLIILVTNPGLALTSPTSEAGSAFDPQTFHPFWQVANCPGINRAENKTVELQLGTSPTTAFAYCISA